MINQQASAVEEMHTQTPGVAKDKKKLSLQQALSQVGSFGTY